MPNFHSLLSLVVASAGRVGIMLPAIQRDHLAQPTPRNVRRALQDLAHVALSSAVREFEGTAAVRALADERLAVHMTRDVGGRWCVTARVVCDWDRGK